MADFLEAGYTHENALDVVLGVSLATLCNYANNLANTPINPELQPYASLALRRWQMTFFSEEFINWLDDHADQIDKESCAAGNQLIERIAAEGAFRVGVPEELGGRGGNDTDVIEVLKEAHHSLTASFISWGQRTFIDNVLKSANSYFRDHYLEGLLSGEYAGATALSNAVKFLSDLEELNVSIVEEDGQLYLKGRLPWVTNARADRFLSIFVAGFEDGSHQPLVLAVPSDAENFSRSADLEFVSLQGGNTAALTFNHVPLQEEWILAQDTRSFWQKIAQLFSVISLVWLLA